MITFFRAYIDFNHVLLHLREQIIQTVQISRIKLQNLITVNGTDHSSHITAKWRGGDKVENGQDLVRCRFY